MTSRISPCQRFARMITGYEAGTSFRSCSPTRLLTDPVKSALIRIGSMPVKGMDAQALVSHLRSGHSPGRLLCIPAFECTQMTCRTQCLIMLPELCQQTINSKPPALPQWPLPKLDRPCLGPGSLFWSLFKLAVVFHIPGWIQQTS